MLFAMCGRYALAGDWSEFIKTFDLTKSFDVDPALYLAPRWNIAPCQTAGYEAPIVTSSGIVMARFWYLPSTWSRPLKALPTSFNARSEELESKPFFTGYQLGLVPTTGWREFPGAAGSKRSFVFTQAPMFAFGCVHTTWLDRDTGEQVPSFAILTAEPSPLVSPIHDRMPLLVPANDHAAWVAPDAELPTLLPRALKHSHHTPLTVYEASTYGNSTRMEGPECVQPLAAAKQLKLF